MRKFIFFFCTLLCFCSLPPLYAQTPNFSLSISPSVIEKTVQPGTTNTQNITLKNTSTNPVDLSVYATTFSPAGTNGTLVFQTEAKESALWFTFPKTTIHLASGESTMFPIRISIPNDTKTGGYYVSVFFEQIGNTSSIEIEPRLGALFLLSVPGDLLTSAKIESFQIIEPHHIHQYPFFEGGNMQFTQTVKNNGTIHLHAQNMIRISNIFGQTVATIYPHDHILLPNETLYENTNWQVNPFLFGYFNATLTIANGPHILATKSISFWLIPIWLFITLLAVSLCLIGLGVYIFEKHYSRGYAKYIEKRNLFKK